MVITSTPLSFPEIIKGLEAQHAAPQTTLRLFPESSELPDSANKSTKYPVQVEFQINE